MPPPILEKNDGNTVAMKLANAVSFNIEGPSKRTSFDITLTPLISEPTLAEISLSSGESYPSPALNGAAVAMRLYTYVNLPSQDLSLQDAWTANLDLSLNLWLCADGIDILKGVEVTAFERSPPAPLSPNVAARFAATWMDDVTQKRFFNAYSTVYPKLTYLEWETHISFAISEPQFSRDLTQKCRSFQWYVEMVNNELSDLLAQPVEVQRMANEKPAGGSDSNLPEKSARKNEEEGVDGPDLSKPLHKEESDVVDEEGGPNLAIPLHREKLKPKIPLCDECLTIVQKADPIDISFVDASNGHVDHPHLGARDTDGKLGYVHDETTLRLHPPASSIQENELRGLCLKRDNNYKMLNEKVYVDLEYDKKMESSGKQRDKLFCVVYTIEPFHAKIPAIRETWGYVSRCIQSSP